MFIKKTHYIIIFYKSNYMKLSCVDSALFYNWWVSGKFWGNIFKSNAQRKLFFFFKACCGAWTHKREIETWADIKSWMFNQQSQPPRCPKRNYFKREKVYSTDFQAPFAVGVRVPPGTVLCSRRDTPNLQKPVNLHMASPVGTKGFVRSRWQAGPPTGSLLDRCCGS